MGEMIVMAILIGIIPAYIAMTKGRSFLLWWLYGAALFIVALPHSLIMKTNIQALELKKISEGMKKCPYCAELIKSEAIICRYCGKDLPNKKAIGNCVNCSKFEVIPWDQKMGNCNRHNVSTNASDSCKYYSPKNLNA